MNYTRAEMNAMLVAGAAIGAGLTYTLFARRYNKLVRNYNLILERDRIKKRVFAEVLPQLPDNYTLSEQSRIDMMSWTMFADNDL